MYFSHPISSGRIRWDREGTTFPYFPILSQERIRFFETSSYSWKIDTDYLLFVYITQMEFNFNREYSKQLEVIQA